LLSAPTLGYSQADSPPPPAEAWLSPMRITRLKTLTWFYTTIDVSPAARGPEIRDRMVAIAATMKTAGVVPAGGLVFIFHGTDSSKPMKLDVGYPVADSAAAIPGLQSGKLDSALSATAIYTGSPQTLDISRLDAAIVNGGHVRGDVMIQRSLYYEGLNSPNNIILVEIPLRE